MVLPVIGWGLIALGTAAAAAWKVSNSSSSSDSDTIYDNQAEQQARQAAAERRQAEESQRQELAQQQLLKDSSIQVKQILTSLGLEHSRILSDLALQNMASGHATANSLLTELAGVANVSPQSLVYLSNILQQIPVTTSHNLQRQIQGITELEQELAQLQQLVR